MRLPYLRWILTMALLVAQLSTATLFPFSAAAHFNDGTDPLATTGQGHPNVLSTTTQQALKTRPEQQTRLIAPGVMLIVPPVKGSSTHHEASRLVEIGPGFPARPVLARSYHSVPIRHLPISIQYHPISLMKMDTQHDCIPTIQQKTDSFTPGLCNATTAPHTEPTSLPFCSVESRPSCAATTAPHAEPTAGPASQDHDGPAYVTINRLAAIAGTAQSRQMDNRTPKNLAPAAPYLSVWTGYADTFHSQPPTGAFPAPWAIPSFEGQGPPWEGGAIRLDNPSSQPVAVSDVTVSIHGRIYNLWGNFAIPPISSTILAQTFAFSTPITDPSNFDTSDTYTNNPQCIPASTGFGSDPPQITVTFASGARSVYYDVNHGLDSQELDLCNGRNESVPWQSTDSPFQLSTQGPTMLLPDGAGGYQSNPFTITALVTDVVLQAPQGVTVSLSLPSGLSLTQGVTTTSTTTIITTTGPFTGSAEVDFGVWAAAVTAPTNVAYTITATSPISSVAPQVSMGNILLSPTGGTLPVQMASIPDHVFVTGGQTAVITGMVWGQSQTRPLPTHHSQPPSVSTIRPEI